ncbi:MAG: DUF5665 domain-containing protein [bacterium]
MDKKIEELLNLLKENNRRLAFLRLGDYLAYLNNPWKLLYHNFLGGVARGVGIALGATLIAALIMYSLSKMVTLPLIGQYIAEIVRIVELYLSQK